MSGARRPVAGALRRLTARALAKVEPVIFPETTDPAEHWQRQVLNAAVDDYLGSIGTASLRAAEISGSFHSGREWHSYESLDYPEFDICADVAEPARYDVVICEQVLEHVPDPFRAAENLRMLTAPGGHVVVSTPFLVKVHELPDYGMKDYWRFTPRGLRTLLERGGLEVSEVGSWGNRECVVGNLGSWSAYRRWHSLANERDLPLQVWAFARNVASG